MRSYSEELVRRIQVQLEARLPGVAVFGQITNYHRGMGFLLQERALLANTREYQFGWKDRSTQYPGRNGPEWSDEWIARIVDDWKFWNPPFTHPSALQLEEYRAERKDD